MLLQYRYKPL